MITWFVAKGGPNFNLFKNDGDANSGTWYTPTNPNNNKPYGLSHLSFYDTAVSTSSTSGGASGNVPEPSASSLALLGMTLLGATLWRRRRSDGS